MPWTEGESVCQVLRSRRISSPERHLRCSSHWQTSPEVCWAILSWTTLPFTATHHQQLHNIITILYTGRSRRRQGPWCNFDKWPKHRKAMQGSCSECYKSMFSGQEEAFYEIGRDYPWLHWFSETGRTSTWVKNHQKNCDLNQVWVCCAHPLPQSGPSMVLEPWRIMPCCDCLWVTKPQQTCYIHAASKNTQKHPPPLTCKVPASPTKLDTVTEVVHTIFAPPRIIHIQFIVLSLGR